MAETLAQIRGLPTYLGDFRPGDTISLLWPVINSDNTPAITVPTGTVRVVTNQDGIVDYLTDDDGNLLTDDDGNLLTTDDRYENNGDDVTVTADYLSMLGTRLVVIDTSADQDFYAGGREYWIVWDVELPGGGAPVSIILGSFSIANRSATKALPEVSGTPSYPITPQNMLRWLYTKVRHIRKTTLGGEEVTYKDDDVTVLCTAPVTDDGIEFIKGKDAVE